MNYKTVVIDYAPKTKQMAAAVEEKSNKMALIGYELVTFSLTNSAKAILVFKSSDDTAAEVTEAKTPEDAEQ